jgi:hypothetical protein
MVDQQNTRMCTGCGRQIPTEYNVCPHCGRPQNVPQTGSVQQPYGQPQQYESMGALKYVLYFLSLSFIIGLIIYLIWNNDPNPEKRHVAKNCLIFGFIGIVLWVLCCAAQVLFWGTWGWGYY